MKSSGALGVLEAPCHVECRPEVPSSGRRSASPNQPTQLLFFVSRAIPLYAQYKPFFSSKEMPPSRSKRRGTTRASGNGTTDNTIPTTSGLERHVEDEETLNPISCELCRQRKCKVCAGQHNQSNIWSRSQEAKSVLIDETRYPV